MLEKPSGDCMTSLVVSHSPPLFNCHEGLLLDTSDDSLGSCLKLLKANRWKILSCSDDGGLVAHTGDISATETWSQGGHLLCIFGPGLLRVQLNLLKMDLVDGSSLVDVRRGDLDLPVKSSRPHESAIQDV